MLAHSSGFFYHIIFWSCPISSVLVSPFFLFCSHGAVLFFDMLLGGEGRCR